MRQFMYKTSNTKPLIIHRQRVIDYQNISVCPSISLVLRILWFNKHAYVCWCTARYPEMPISCILPVHCAGESGGGGGGGDKTIGFGEIYKMGGGGRCNAVNLWYIANPITGTTNVQIYIYIYMLSCATTVPINPGRVNFCRKHESVYAFSIISRHCNVSIS